MWTCVSMDGWRKEKNEQSVTMDTSMNVFPKYSTAADSNIVRATKYHFYQNNFKC